jgi:hypothetical protein
MAIRMTYSANLPGNSLIQGIKEYKGMWQGNI